LTNTTTEQILTQNNAENFIQAVYIYTVCNCAMENNYQLLIERLDGFIRKYYLNKLLRGVLLFLALVTVYYLFASVFEYKLYFSSSVRKFILFSFMGVFIFALAYWVLLPLFHYLNLGNVITHETAATIIGNHFQPVKDKLLNILQLKTQSQNAYNRDLIEASINQKMDGIKLVPFTQAVNLSENNKYLKYVLPPLLAIAMILLIAPQIFKESNKRLANPNVVFAKKAPFDFILENKNLKAIQYQDYEVALSIKGETLPNDVYINDGGKNYKMEKTAPDKFKYRYTNLQKDVHFYFSAGEYNSDEHTLRILKKPVIANFSTQLTYPGYTKKPNEIIKNTGDLVVPAGTTINWIFETSGTDKVNVQIDGQSYVAQKESDDKYTFTKRILKDTRYTLYVSNNEVENGDSVSFAISATPDNLPAISVERIQDTLNKDFALFLGAVSDDYGLSRLEFHSALSDDKGKIISAKKQTLPLANSSISDFNFPLDFENYGVKPGYKLNYYFEVWDNDAVNGPKSAKSQTYLYEKPTITQLEKQEFQNQEAIKDDLSSAMSKAQKLAADIKEMKKRILSKQNLNWEDKKQLEQIQKEHQELLQELKEMEKKYDENLKNQDEYKKVDEEILQKEEKIQEMMQDLMNDEMKDLMKQIEEILQKMEQRNTFENLDKMQMSNENLKNELDKMQDLFKQLQLEQKAQETIDKLDQLAKDQEQLSNQTEQNQNNSDQLKQKQEELNKKMDNIKENLQQLDKINKENEEKLNTDGNEEMSEDIEQDMDKASDELGENEKQKAGKSQKSASQKMKQMAQKMKNDLNKMQMSNTAEDIQTIRQLLENLVKLSFDQEQLMNELKKTDIQTPKYVYIMQKQYDLRDDAKMIGDSLQSLGKRQFQLQQFISDELYKLNREMKKSLDNLEQRFKPQAGVAQQMVMTSANNLALMLSESLDNLQQQLQQQQEGSGSCDKPGGKGKKGGKPKMSLGEMQKQMNEQLKKMQDGMQNGKSGKQMGKDFADAVEKQAAIREALRKMKEKMSQQNKNGVDDVLNKMEENEKELMMKKLTPETIKRQKEIETRLLEYEKAEREQGEEEKRQSKTAQEVPRKLPPALEEFLQKHKSAMEMYKTVPPNLKPFYKELVEKYFRTVQ